MSSVTANALIAEARAILDRAEAQHRDLSDFESGRVDALLDVAGRFGRSGARESAWTISTVEQCR